MTARWILPVEEKPLPRGTLTVQDDRIVAVEPAGNRTSDYDFGNAIILPGFVNAHTHLDLSGLRGLLPPSADFVGWLRGVIAHRRSRTPEQIQQDTLMGLREALYYGTTLVGDISGLGLSWDVLQAAPCRAIVFYELLGLTADRARVAWDLAAAWLHDHKSTATCLTGLSPHAPYSVRAALFRKASQAGVPLSVHCAESQAEMELLEQRQGPFVSFLKELGVWDPAGLVAGIDGLLKETADARHCLLVHANYLPWPRKLPAGRTVVYCPRTHAAFGHPDHPLRSLMRLGYQVALGTDSLASNPDLDLLAEMRFVQERYPEIQPEPIVRMGTINGARALGWGRLAGGLTKHKSADFVVLDLPNDAGRDPYPLVLDPRSRIRAVYFQGQCNPALKNLP